MRYTQTEKEAYALVWPVERVHLYLYGREFELVTDHKPLEVIFEPRSKPCARVEQLYKYTVKYKPGKTNVADPLSRLRSLWQASAALHKNITSIGSYKSSSRVPSGSQNLHPINCVFRYVLVEFYISYFILLSYTVVCSLLVFVRTHTHDRMHMVAQCSELGAICIYALNARHQRPTYIKHQTIHFSTDS